MTEFLQQPAVAGAIAGIVTATAVDFQAFRAFESFGQFKSYSWGTAAWRAFQGAVIGALSVYGIGGL